MFFPVLLAYYQSILIRTKWWGVSWEKAFKLSLRPIAIGLGKRLAKGMTNKTKRSIKWVQSTQRLKTKYAGIHLLAEFWYGKNIKNSKELKRILITAAKKAKSTPLKICTHKFSPQGMTGVVLLAESHIAFHSWPELSYLAIDIFTCGSKTMPRRALEYLKKELKPKKVEIKGIKRGAEVSAHVEKISFQ